MFDYLIWIVSVLGEKVPIFSDILTTDRKMLCYFLNKI